MSNVRDLAQLVDSTIGQISILLNQMVADAPDANRLNEDLQKINEQLEKYKSTLMYEAVTDYDDDDETETAFTGKPSSHMTDKEFAEWFNNHVRTRWQDHMMHLLITPKICREWLLILCDKGWYMKQTSRFTYEITNVSVEPMNSVKSYYASDYQLDKCKQALEVIRREPFSDEKIISMVDFANLLYQCTNKTLAKCAVDLGFNLTYH